MGWGQRRRGKRVTGLAAGLSYRMGWKERKMNTWNIENDRVGETNEELEVFAGKVL